MKKCERCGLKEAKINFNMLESSMKLCTNCFNKRMSEELEVDLEQLIETFSLKDY
ncbi:MAG: hypothetical protein K0S80_1507, partial [Neobacillus sp.]|nr:hypothetical protein [Neobacillus sp.]